MGKKIDGFVLTLALAGALYFFYRGAFESRILALALALLTCAVVCKFLRRLWRLISRGKWLQRRRIRKSAGTVAMQIACLPGEEARKKLETLLKTRYEGDYAVELIQSPPSGALSQRELFEVWKAHRGEAQLAVCVTCDCDQACRMMGSGLRQPRLALIDAELLSQLVAANPGVLELPQETQRAPQRLRRSLSLLFNRKNAPRCFLFSAAMLTMYVFSASLSYLISSMALLFFGLASLHRAPQPAKLF